MQHDVDNTHVMNSGHISHDSVELLGFDPAARWVTAEEFRPGDVVILSMKCLHGSIHNQSANTLRLSCDVRFQPTVRHDARFSCSPHYYYYYYSSSITIS
jgi:hypothetical protein